MSDTPVRVLVQDPGTEITETLVDFVAKTTIKHPFSARCADWIAATSEISPRDNFELFFSISGDRKTTDGSNASLDEVANFLQECSDESEVEIRLHIKKHTTNNKVSIYSIEHYSEFVEQISLNDFFSSISTAFNEHLCFEVFSDIPSFGSKTITFQPVSAPCQALPNQGALNASNRRGKVLLFKENCLVSHLPFSLDNLIPSDFYLEQSTSFTAIERKFRAACSALGF